MTRDGGSVSVQMALVFAFLAPLAAAVGGVSVGDGIHPPCKSQCDSSFTQDDLLEHPGIASICHRGCEIFTVALITTPIGGIPLIGIGQDKQMNDVPYKTSIRIDSGTMLRQQSKDQKNRKHENESSKHGYPIMEKALKQKQQVENEITHRMESIGASQNAIDTERMSAIMSKMEVEKKRMKDQIRKYSEEHKLDINKTKPEKRVIENEEKKQPQENKKVFVKHVVKYYGPNGEMNVSENEDISYNDKENAAIKPEIGVKGDSSDRETKLKSKTGFHIHHIIENSMPKENNKPESDAVTKVPIKIFPTLKGEKAREILNKVRTLESKREELNYNSGQSVPHGPVKVSKEKPSSDKKESGRPNQKHFSKTGNNLVHSSSSKTTMQPLPHPVQDHPVHANRQITTDSSDADERKTTTPQTSNPVVSMTHRIQEFDAFSLLANKLGTVDNHAHPFLHLNFLKSKPDFGLMMPQQISIIEIVKKKNNIDFEKLHQDHMKEAARCPKIQERFEQAKHSCRHACSTAYNSAQEQEACVSGCKIQATKSTNQVLAQTPPTTPNPKTLKHTSGTLLRKITGPENTIVQPGGLFSTFNMMFSNLAGKIGFGDDEIIVPRLGKDLIDPEIAKESKAIGAPALPHLGVEIFFSGTHRKPENHERIINTETVFQIVDHREPHKSESEILQEQLDHHTELMNQELEKQGNLLADPLNIGREGRKFMENELNRQLEIMGEHLNEQPNKEPSGALFFPKFFDQFISRIDKLDERERKQTVPMEIRINGLKMFESKSPLNRFFHLNKKNSGKEEMILSVHHDKDKKQENHEKSDAVKVEKATASATVTDGLHINTVQLQQLDLLDCISRKSGLPRWLIASTVFTSALVVFWLCFSLSTPMEDNKLSKPKPTTVVICDGRTTDDCNDADCFEKKKLLPADEFIKIRLETV